jgi:hypothetical protein
LNAAVHPRSARYRDPERTAIGVGLNVM